MHPEPARPRQARYGLWAAAACAALLSVLAGWVSFQRSLAQTMDDTARRGDNVLQLAASTLSGQLERFERLPALVAEQPVVQRLAANPADPGLVQDANAYLERLQQQLDASDIYLMGRTGVTLAASNHASETSFVGGNFAFRPYFYDAMRGGTGRFYALGTTSRKRGYYFGAPVRLGDDIAGVLVFKIDLDAIEETWRGGDYAVLVTDPDGVVFLSSRSDWLFSALRPLNDGARARIAATRRYAGATVGLLNIRQDVMTDGHHLLTIAEDGQTRSYLQRDLPMLSASWQVHVLIDTAPARREAATAAISAVLAVGVLALIGLLLAQHRQRLAERLILQAQARADLERRVAERTEELRQAQADLVQAGKLAALGQMSAALSHEFNQPLAAARTYADNATVLMDRGRWPEARQNLDRILSLIDRMTSISRHLRSFARKPGQKLSAVSLPEVIEAAVEIASLRLNAAGATLTIDLDPDLPLAVAGPVRLQQVLVNILTNAADAVEGQTRRQITLAAQTQGNRPVIQITDSGPGVPDGLVDRIFDPFFSTKGVGKGLGLGLSISYNIIKDFGGDLSVSNAPLGGAVFTIRLSAAPTDTRQAAE
ncbi:sensor histidine kinase [Pseudotabrizicola sp. L79]|uniref:sensor histidine kinase n=1 Tax=Pseudotabrizicola sp. L79 TaxID=3118402 RepID=UPI002F942C0D